MIIKHHSNIEWDKSRWPNFKAGDFACSHCGETYWDALYFDGIQRVRLALGMPVYLSSAHRCTLHNRKVGGALNSQHKKIALDVSLRGLDPAKLLGAARAAGFSSFGFYKTFLHIDKRPGRRWITKSGKRTWNGLVTF